MGGKAVQRLLRLKMTIAAAASDEGRSNAQGFGGVNCGFGSKALSVEPFLESNVTVYWYICSRSMQVQLARYRRSVGLPFKPRLVHA
jgi:hypothetical protein